MAIDPAADIAAESPRRLSGHPLDANASPTWSPDGEWVAYVSRRPGDPEQDEADNAGLVTIRRIDGSDERQFRIRQQYHQTSLRWWPDGGSIVVRSESNLERRDRDTGEIVETILDGRKVSAFEIDARERRLYYAIAGRGQRLDQLRVLDLDTRSDRLVYEGPFWEDPFSLARDGRSMAVIVRTERSSQVLLIPTDGSEPRAAWSSAERIVPGPFTPDGESLFLSRVLDASTSRSELILLDLASQSTRSLPVVMPQIWQLALHPVGRRLAFVAGDPGQRLFAMRGDLVR